MGRVQLVTDATVEPLTVAEAKLFLRIDDTSEDASLLPEMITSARRRVEAYTHRSLVTTAWRYTVDGRSVNRAIQRAARRTGVADVLPRLSLSGVELVLPRPPVIAIQSVKYYGVDDVAVTYSASNYRLDVSSDAKPRLVFVYGATLPAVRDLGSFEVNYTSGYGATGALVPDDLVQAVKRVMAANYDMRGDTIGPDVKAILDDCIPEYKVRRV